jgi:hypothetical protein
VEGGINKSLGGREVVPCYTTQETSTLGMASSGGCGGDSFCNFYGSPWVDVVQKRFTNWHERKF